MTMEQLRQSPAPGLGLDPDDLGPLAPVSQADGRDGLTEGPADDAMDDQPDGDRQITTDSTAIDEGQNNDSDLGADVAGDIGPKHD